MIKLIDARFVITAVEPKGYPTGHSAEVAFVGRSNVGKSSMINALTGRKKLVRVSNTPGRTRTLNFFDVELERGGVRHRVRLADLPGYGFAKASKAERAQWEKMITTYLEKRHHLEAVVSHRFGLEEAGEAYRVADEGRQGKVAIVQEASPGAGSPG